MNFRSSKSSFSVLLVLFAFNLCLIGQTNTYQDDAPPPPPKPGKSTVPKKIGPPLLTIVEVDEKMGMKIYSQAEAGENPTDSSSTKPLKTTRITLNQKIPAPFLRADEVIIKPNPDLKYEGLVKAAKKIRSQTKQKITVKFGDYFYALISKDTTRNPPRPNPLFLLVDIDRQGKIFLNKEDEGTTEDFSKLQNHLVSIFKDRAASGVFREGANEIEQTVFIKVPHSLVFLEVIKIAEAVKATGANPIGLQIDDLY
jgi:biopolymer transport protein ExbD